MIRGNNRVLNLILSIFKSQMHCDSELLKRQVKYLAIKDIHFYIKFKQKSNIIIFYW